MDPSIDEPRYRDINPRATIQRSFTVRNITLQIVHGDLTEEKTDAITNAANDNLWLGGGVAGAIDRKGGPEIDRECTEYVRKHGNVAIGDVAVTRAGRLPCKYVIHAVGPIYNFHQQSPALLRSAVLRTLEAADSLAVDGRRAESVSIPGISSGIFGFPKDLCAQIMIQCFMEFVETKKHTGLRLIRYINFDTPTVSCFEEGFDRARGKLLQLADRVNKAAEDDRKPDEDTEPLELSEESKSAAVESAVDIAAVGSPDSKEVGGPTQDEGMEAGGPTQDEDMEARSPTQDSKEARAASPDLSGENGDVEEKKEHQ